MRRRRLALLLVLVRPLWQAQSSCGDGRRLPPRRTHLPRMWPGRPRRPRGSSWCCRRRVRLASKACGRGRVPSSTCMRSRSPRMARGAQWAPLRRRRRRPCATRGTLRRSASQPPSGRLHKSKRSFRDSTRESDTRKRASQPPPQQYCRQHRQHRQRRRERRCQRRHPIGGRRSRCR